jgi:AcrR family transcriptional regulator
MGEDRRQRDDRRSRRTRRLVTAAMSELLVEMAYDQITIQAILDRADIGRATFYNHFRDKLDVVDAVAAEMLQGVAIPSVPPGSSALPIADLFRHAAERATSLRAMLDTPSGEVFWRESQKAWSAAIERSYASPRGRPGGTVPAPLAAEFVTGGFTAILRWWLREGMPYTPDQMAVMAQALLPDVLADRRPSAAS